MNKAIGYSWLNSQGNFALENPQKTSYPYFPIANEAGLMGAVTPTLNGDIKSSQNTFLMEPVSSENLHNNRSSRNFRLHITDHGAWSCTGVSARQLANAFTDQTDIDPSSHTGNDQTASTDGKPEITRMDADMVVVRIEGIPAGQKLQQQIIVVP